MFIIYNLKRVLVTESLFARSVHLLILKPKVSLIQPQNEINSVNKESVVQLSSLDDTEASLNRKSVVIAHRQLLRALYHMPLDLSTTPSDFVERNLKDFVRIAEMYECRSVVDPPLQKHLIHFKTSDTWLARCVQDPARMLELALMTKCNWMFIEVFAHLISDIKHWNFNKSLAQKYQLERLFEEKTSAHQAVLKNTALRMVTEIGICSGNHSDGETIARLFFHQQMASLMKISLSDVPSRVFRKLAAKEMPSLGTGSMETLRQFSAYFGRGHFTDCKEAYGRLLTEASLIANHLLVNQCHVSTKFQKGSGTDLAPLLCFTISEDELPWNQNPT